MDMYEMTRVHKKMKRTIFSKYTRENASKVTGHVQLSA